jgi:hypothetical protein
MQGQVRFARKEIEGKADQSLIQARRDRSESAGYRLPRGFGPVPAFFFKIFIDKSAYRPIIISYY